MIRSQRVYNARKEFIRREKVSKRERRQKSNNALEFLAQPRCVRGANVEESRYEGQRSRRLATNWARDEKARDQGASREQQDGHQVFTVLRVAVLRRR